MTTLTVSTTTNYSALNMTAVTAITFTNAIGTTAIATFVDAQFLGPLSMPGVTFSPGNNRMVINDCTNIDWSLSTMTNFGRGDAFAFNGTAGADFIRGTEVVDVIHGNSGNDTLEGSQGNDQVFGDDGDDVIYGARGSADGGAGNDRVFVMGTGAGVGLLVDITDGGGGRNIGNGLKLSGFEELRGVLGAQNDTVTGAGRSDRVDLGAGDDSMQGAGGKDVLTGGEGADSLDGGTEADILIGGFGTDLLTGGLGADRFVFQHESQLGSGVTADVVTDFTQGSDKIDLWAIDGQSGGATNDPVLFVGQTEFLAGYGLQLRYVKTATTTILELGLGVDDEVPAQIILQGVFDITLNDLIL